MFLSGHHLVLGSQSPRRKQLLEQSGFNFEVRAIEIDETIIPGTEPSEAAEQLAIRKARAHADTLLENEVLITADTVVVFENRIYGKPKNKSHAIQTLRELSGHEHEVYSGVCLMTVKGILSFTEKSVVCFDDISSEEAHYYFDRDNPMDKAGAYGIQDWIGLSKVKYIHGSYTNILGMPMAQTYSALKRFVESQK